MAKVWVLDTETKGTGAAMVPLEKQQRPREGGRERRRVFVPPTPREREPEAPRKRAPRSFRIVDVVTQQALAEGASMREAVDVLRGVRSAVDVRVYVHDDAADRWRLLTHREQSLLWEAREGQAREAARDGAA